MSLGHVAGNIGSEYNFTSTGFVDTGDNAWQLTAASLVGLQSVPGLVVM
jgi:Amt family ammonium transporter